MYVQIDDTGLGGGVTDRLKEVRKEQKLYKMQIIPINAAEKIETDTAAGKDAAEKYNNLTTAMWASTRDLLDNKQIVIEDDEQTIGQLSSRKYTMTSNGKLEIESKKEMKKRGLDSPTEQMLLLWHCISERSRNTQAQHLESKNYRS